MGLEDFVSSGNERLDQQLKFTAEIDKMTSVLRRTVLIDRSRRENDAEHSWHIGVMAMLFSEYANVKPDIGRAVQMCLVHDLVEIYAGDTFAFDYEANKDKEAREQAAADKLFQLLPEEQGSMIRTLWEEFDAMETDDAKYAACLDRIQPFFHNSLTLGHTWVEAHADRAMVERRMAIVKEVMPEVYAWMKKTMNNAVEKGWIQP